MDNLELVVKVELRPTTQTPAPENASPEKVEPGCFRIVLNADDACDISALEQGLLQTNYPALRDALAGHLQEVSKKKRSASSSN